MEFTPVFNFPCLGPDDYAAYATYMQCLAEDLEAQFNETNDALEVVRNNYAGVWRNIVPIVSDGSGNLNFTPTAMTNIFWNDPNNAPFTGTGVATDPIRYQFPGMVDGGLYEIGVTAFYNQGATANSTRQLFSDAYFRTTTGIQSALALTTATEESLTGGEALFGDYQLGLLYREFTPGSGNFGIPVGFTCSGFEADAGTITIPIGGVSIWCVLLGTNTLIGAN